MLTTVIIILREVLEASILISLLLALRMRLPLYRYWLHFALTGGLLGASLYANSFDAISGWFDGSGQEVVNGLSLLAIAIGIALQLLLPGRQLLTSLSAIFIVALAMTREGAEIIVYYSGIAEMQRSSSSTIIGGIIGGGLGICLGILCFTLLRQLTERKHLLVSSLLFILICAGQLAEATQCFIQAGWILTDEPVWDSSNWLAESSVPGELLYAVFAYEASPTLEEVVAWCATVLLLGGGLFFVQGRSVKS